MFEIFVLPRKKEFIVVFSNSFSNLCKIFSAIHYKTINSKLIFWSHKRREEKREREREREREEVAEISIAFFLLFCRLNLSLLQHYPILVIHYIVAVKYTVIDCPLSLGVLFLVGKEHL